jgi:hypothetical protein
MGKCFPELEPGGLKPAVRTGVVQSLSQQARRYGSGEQLTEGRVSQRSKSAGGVRRLRSVSTRCRLALLLALVSGIPMAAVAQGTDSAGSTTHEEHVHGPGSLLAARDASGTAWLPDAAPMSGIHATWGRWESMFHGIVFGQFLIEPGDRHRTGGFSTHQFSSVNWVMASTRRRAGAGWIGLRGMASLEAWTLGDCGYISFLATGENCEGDTIHDRQHPHDAVMEAAAEYDRPVGTSTSLRWQIYGGLAGEPALGPPGFPHRVSAELNPIAPIGHHWLDSSHVTFGLVTNAVYNAKWKAEASLFNGREPDEDRTDLDLGPLDSFSGRITLAASRQLVLQVSAAHLEQAEFEFPPLPRSDVDRVTASATWQRPLGGDSSLAATLAWGLNSGLELVPEGAFRSHTNAGLLETSLTLHDRHTLFGRAEAVQKPAHDLHAHEYATAIFTVGKLQAGYVRELTVAGSFRAGVGGTFALSLVPPELVSRYGGRAVPGYGIFVSLRPPRHRM